MDKGKEIVYAIAARDIPRLLGILSQDDNVNTNIGTFGKTSLMLAISSCDLQIIDTILGQPNISINAVDNFGDNALCYGAAAPTAHKDLSRSIFHRLISAGININHLNKAGNTLLLEIIRSGINWFNEEYIEFLLDAGADLHAKDTTGKTAYDSAVDLGKKEIIIILNKYYLRIIPSIGGYMLIIPRDIRDYIQKFVFFMSTTNILSEIKNEFNLRKRINECRLSMANYPPVSTIMCTRVI